MAYPADHVTWLSDQSRSRFSSERMHAAADPMTPKDDLARLLNDDDPAVRRTAAANPAARNLAPAAL